MLVSLLEGGGGDGGAEWGENDCVMCLLVAGACLRAWQGH